MAAMRRITRRLMPVALILTVLTGVPAHAAAPAFHDAAAPALHDGAAPALHDAVAPALHDAAGLRVVAVEQLDDRLLDVTLSTDALARDVHVRILRPAGYSADRDYPVLYLLHGGNDDYKSWTDKGDAAAITKDLPLLVVMPDAGPNGWYSDWYNFGAGGHPRWERFHIDQLIPWTEANFRTVAGQYGRAIAGLSMGGFGAMSYAARHPGLFSSAMSFSGAVDTRQLPVTVIVDVSPLATLKVPTAVWGTKLLNNDIWRAHNPWAQAARLSGLNLGIYTGNGLAGPYDNPPLPDSSVVTEAAVHEMSRTLHEKLARLGIPHTYNDYGPGSHTWPYWQRDLRWALPSIMATFDA